MPLNINNLTAPGVYLYEDNAGVPPTEIASFNRYYGLGSATGTVIPPNVPTQVISLEDFTNQFGAAAAVTTASLNIFFANVSGIEGQAFFSKVAIAPRAVIDVTALVAETEYGLMVQGEPITYTSDADPTNQEVITGLIAAINDAGLGVTATPKLDDAGPTYTDGEFFVYQNDPMAAPFTVTETDANLAIPVAVSVPAAPLWWDYVYAINNSFDEDMPLGFVGCPQAFQSLMLQSERLRVANALEAIAASFNWIAVLDCGPTTEIETPAQLLTEAALYTSPLGHGSYYAPWMRDADNNPISPGLLPAIVFLKRSQREGFQQPPAGTRFPIRGILDADIKILTSVQASLNPAGVNVIRLISGVGWVVYGARTRSANPLYRFVNTRIILNIYNRTLFESLVQANFVFSAIDGINQFFGRIKETANAVAYRFWRGGAFFGTNPQEAFLNICDRTNNADVDLEAGLVQLESYVAPAPTAERILARVIRVPISGVPGGTN